MREPSEKANELHGVNTWQRTGQKTFKLTLPLPIIKGRKTKSALDSSRLLGDCVYRCVQNGSGSQ